MKNVSQDTWCPASNSKRVSSEYLAEALPLESISSVDILSARNSKYDLWYGMQTCVLNRDLK
jgi:hypothetical protein